MENGLLNEEGCNNVPKIHNKFLLKHFESQKNQRKLPQSMAKFRKYLANEKFIRKTPSNKLTETYKNLQQFYSEGMGERRITTSIAKTRRSTPDNAKMEEDSSQK